MTPRHHQRGLTAIGMVMLLSCIAFFALFALRLVPIYIESYKVDSAVKSLKEQENVSQKLTKEVRDLLVKRLSIDDVEHVKPEDINIAKDGNTLKVDVSYEVRAPLFSNIELLVTFDKHAEVPL